MNKGEPVYRFKADRIPDALKDKITMVRDFMYSVGESYVNKILARAKDTQNKYEKNPNAKGIKNQEKPRIRIDYLKTNSAYADFNNVLQQAKKYDEQLYKESLAGTEPVMELSDGMRIVRLTTPEALDFEGEYMGHCVGKGSYDDGVGSGSVQIYSLRDENGEPHATLEVNGNKTVEQCKGKQDKAPLAKYRPYLQEFVLSQKFEIEGDVKSIGLIKCGGKYYDVFNLPKDKKLVLNGDLDISDMGLSELPDLSNLIVKGFFDCGKNKLSDLQGSPLQVMEGYCCSVNELTTLKGLSSKVGSLDCSHNKLTKLEYLPDVIDDLCLESNCLKDFTGAPKIVRGNLNANFNPLISFAGFPEEVDGEFRAINNDLAQVEFIADKVKDSVFIYNQSKDFFIVVQDGEMIDLTKQPDGFVYKDYIDLSFCNLKKLPNLSHIIVDGDLYCEGNALTSFVGAPKEVRGVFIGNGNPVTSLEGLSKKIGDQLDLIDCPELVTLKGISEEIENHLNLFDCPKLENLDYLPQKGCETINIDDKFVEKYHLGKSVSLAELKAAVAQNNIITKNAAHNRE